MIGLFPEPHNRPALTGLICGKKCRNMGLEGEMGLRQRSSILLYEFTQRIFSKRPNPYKPEPKTTTNDTNFIHEGHE